MTAFHFECEEWSPTDTPPPREEQVYNLGMSSTWHPTYCSFTRLPEDEVRNRHNANMPESVDSTHALPVLYNYQLPQYNNEIAADYRHSYRCATHGIKPNIWRRQGRAYNEYYATLHRLYRKDGANWLTDPGPHPEIPAHVTHWVRQRGYYYYWVRNRIVNTIHRYWTGR